MYRSRVGAGGYGRAVRGFEQFSCPFTHLPPITPPNKDQKDKHEEEKGSC
jgi:hypothetical protein